MFELYQVAVRVVARVSTDCPGFVRLELIDAEGVTHSFVEKDPVVGLQGNIFDEFFPVAARIRCSVIRRMGDVAEIDTMVPDGIESIAGTSSFRVSSAQLHAA